MSKPISMSKHIKWLLPIAVAAGLFTFTPSNADAQQVSNNMTCAQAQAHYERNRQIHTRTRSGKILRIYRGVPRSQRHKLFCPDDGDRIGLFDDAVFPQMVRTKDTSRCVISYYCR